MADYYFDTPFAVSGDQVVIPEASQPGGEVSFEDGWTSDYEQDQTIDPSAKDIPRPESNWLTFVMTRALKEIQESGTLVWDAQIEYNEDSRVIKGAQEYKSVIPSNIGNDPEDGTNGSWQPSEPNLSGVATGVGTLNLQAPAGVSQWLALNAYLESGAGFNFYRFAIPYADANKRGAMFLAQSGSASNAAASCAYVAGITAGTGATWDNAATYQQGALVRYQQGSDPFFFYKSLIDNNVGNNPASAGSASKWRLIEFTQENYPTALNRTAQTLPPGYTVYACPIVQEDDLGTIFRGIYVPQASSTIRGIARVVLSGNNASDAASAQYVDEFLRGDRDETITSDFRFEGRIESENIASTYDTGFAANNTYGYSQIAVVPIFSIQFNSTDNYRKTNNITNVTLTSTGVYRIDFEVGFGISFIENFERTMFHAVPVGLQITAQDTIQIGRSSMADSIIVQTQRNGSNSNSVDFCLVGYYWGDNLTAVEPS